MQESSQNNNLEYGSISPIKDSLDSSKLESVSNQKNEQIGFTSNNKMSYNNLNSDKNKSTKKKENSNKIMKMGTSLHLIDNEDQQQQQEQFQQNINNHSIQKLQINRILLSQSSDISEYHNSKTIIESSNAFQSSVFQSQVAQNHNRFNGNNDHNDNSVKIIQSYNQRDASKSMMPGTTDQIRKEKDLILSEMCKQHKEKIDKKIKALNQKENIITEINSQFAKDLKRQVSMKKRSKLYMLNTYLVISTSNVLYQVWKIIVILLSFSASFMYAYFAAFIPEQINEELLFLLKIDRYIQSVFIVNCILHFFVEHHHPSLQKPERNLSKIFLIRLKSTFIVDTVTIFPLFQVLNGRISFKYLKLVFLVRMIRLYNGFSLLNVKQFMIQIKSYTNQQIANTIKTNPKLAHDQVKDQTRIGQILLFSKVMKTILIVLNILCLSYLTGIFWYIVIDFTRDSESLQEDNFIDRYNLGYHRKDREVVITLMYYIFTTFSTVGFGDYHPETDLERCLGFVILLFGVLIFSYVMQDLSTMLNEIRQFNKSYEQSDELNLFFGTLKRFNGNHQLDSKVQSKIEQYFFYRWNKDRNLAISTNEEQDLLEQLPWVIQKKIYTDFLFKDFLREYKQFFFTKQDQNKQIYMRFHRGFASNFTKKQFLHYFDHNKYVMPTDELYNELLVEILRNLEPKQIQFGSIIQRQFKVVEEIIFILNGQFEIGYNNQQFQEEFEQQNNIVNNMGFGNHIQKQFTAKDQRRNTIKKINRLVSIKAAINMDNIQHQHAFRKFHFPLKYLPGQCVIGSFEVCFQKESQYLYRAVQNKGKYSNKKIDAFFIRIKNFKKICSLEKFQEIVQSFKANVALPNYLQKVYIPIRLYQQELQRIERNKIKPRRKTINQIDDKIIQLLDKRSINHSDKSSINQSVSNDQSISKSVKNESPSRSQSYRNEKQSSRLKQDDINNLSQEFGYSNLSGTSFKDALHGSPVRAKKFDKEKTIDRAQRLKLKRQLMQIRTKTQNDKLQIHQQKLQMMQKHMEQEHLNERKEAKEEKERSKTQNKKQGIIQATQELLGNDVNKQSFQASNQVRRISINGFNKQYKDHVLQIIYKHQMDQLDHIFNTDQQSIELSDMKSVFKFFNKRLEGLQSQLTDIIKRYHMSQSLLQIEKQKVQYLEHRISQELDHILLESEYRNIQAQQRKTHYKYQNSIYFSEDRQHENRRNNSIKESNMTCTTPLLHPKGHYFKTNQQNASASQKRKKPKQPFRGQINDSDQQLVVSQFKEYEVDTGSISNSKDLSQIKKLEELEFKQIPFPLSARLGEQSEQQLDQYQNDSMEQQSSDSVSQDQYEVPPNHQVNSNLEGTQYRKSTSLPHITKNSDFDLDRNQSSCQLNNLFQQNQAPDQQQAKNNKSETSSNEQSQSEMSQQQTKVKPDIQNQFKIANQNINKYRQAKTNQQSKHLGPTQKDHYRFKSSSKKIEKIQQDQSPSLKLIEKHQQLGIRQENIQLKDLQNLQHKNRQDQNKQGQCSTDTGKRKTVKFEKQSSQNIVDIKDQKQCAHHDLQNQQIQTEVQVVTQYQLQDTKNNTEQVYKYKSPTKKRSQKRRSEVPSSSRVTQMSIDLSAQRNLEQSNVPLQVSQLSMQNNKDKLTGGGLNQQKLQRSNLILSKPKLLNKKLISRKLDSKLEGDRMDSVTAIGQKFTFKQSKVITDQSQKEAYEKANRDIDNLLDQPQTTFNSQFNSSNDMQSMRDQSTLKVGKRSIMNSLRGTYKQRRQFSNSIYEDIQFGHNEEDKNYRPQYAEISNNRMWEQQSQGSKLDRQGQSSINEEIAVSDSLVNQSNYLSNHSEDVFSTRKGYAINKHGSIAEEINEAEEEAENEFDHKSPPSESDGHSSQTINIVQDVEVENDNIFSNQTDSNLVNDQASQVLDQSQPEEYQETSHHPTDNDIQNILISAKDQIISLIPQLESQCQIIRSLKTTQIKTQIAKAVQGIQGSRTRKGGLNE